MLNTNRRRFLSLLAGCAAVTVADLPAGLLSLASAQSRASIRLAVQGTRFTLNDTPTFLYGISYYGGLGATKEQSLADLDRIKSLRLNWIRVWATWGGFDNDISAVDADGSPRQPFLSQLQWLLAECDRRGIVVDVTLSRGNGANGSPGLQKFAAHKKAAETIIAALRDRGNWYLDLGNERNIGDARFVSIDDLTALRFRVRQLCPRLLVTASDGGDIDADELRHYLLDVGVDFICPIVRATASRLCRRWKRPVGIWIR